MSNKSAAVANIVATKPDAVSIADFDQTHVVQVDNNTWKRLWRAKAKSDVENARVLLYMFFDGYNITFAELDEWVEKRGWRIERILSCGGCVSYDHDETDYFDCSMAQMPHCDCVCAYDCMNNYEPTDEMLWSQARRSPYVHAREFHSRGW